MGVDKSNNIYIQACPSIHGDSIQLVQLIARPCGGEDGMSWGLPLGSPLVHESMEGLPVLVCLPLPCLDIRAEDGVDSFLLLGTSPSFGASLPASYEPLLIPSPLLLVLDGLLLPFVILPSLP